MHLDPLTDKKLKIVFVTITFDPEPGAQHGLPLAKWMAAQGHEVKVLTTFPQYPYGKVYPDYKVRPWSWETLEGIRLLRVPMYPSHDTSGFKRMVTYLSFMLSATFIGVPLIGKADVVFFYEPPPTTGIACLAMKWFRRAPFVQHIADMWPETVVESGMVKSAFIKNTINFFVGGFCKYLYKKAYQVSVLSPGFKRLLIERGVPENKVAVNYNWADEGMFKPLEADPELAIELGMTGKFNFVYAGNLGPLQNIETLVEAASLVQDHPEIQLVIIGTGPREAAVKEFAKKLGARNIRFIERRPYTEMPQINALADVLLVHLRDYSFLHTTIPSKTQVSMACGKPILMGVKGDASELVLKAGAGLTFEPENPQSLAEAMVQMAEMPREALKKMGENGLQYYQNHLALNVTAANLERAFLAACAPYKWKRRSVSHVSKGDPGF